MIALLLLLQAALPAARSDSATVGDTIWLARTVSVTPRQTVRPVEWEPPDPIELISPPTVTVRGGTAEIRYPITIWRAGKHKVEIPGPLVLGAGGSADSLPPYVVTLAIASVLPAAPIDSQIAPQPRVDIVPRRGRTLVPLLVLWVVSLAVLFPLRRWWLRRGKPTRTASPLAKAPVPAAPAERWMDAGEHRAVASLAATRLRAAVARQTSSLDGATNADVEDLLATLDRARFGSLSADDVEKLAQQVTQLEDRITRGRA